MAVQIELLDEDAEFLFEVLLAGRRIARDEPDNATAGQRRFGQGANEHRLALPVADPADHRDDERVRLDPQPFARRLPPDITLHAREAVVEYERVGGGPKLRGDRLGDARDRVRPEDPPTKHRPQEGRRALPAVDLPHVEEVRRRGSTCDALPGQDQRMVRVDERDAAAERELADLPDVPPEEGGGGYGAASAEEVPPENGKREERDLDARVLEPRSELAQLREDDERPVPGRIETGDEQLELAVGSVPAARAVQEQHGFGGPPPCLHAPRMTEPAERRLRLGAGESIIEPGMRRLLSPRRTIRADVETWDWPTEMRRVAARFDGREGVFLQLGDSLTLATPNALWARQGYHSRSERAFLDWAHSGRRDETDGWFLATELTGPPEEKRTFTASIGCTARFSLEGGRLPPLADLLARYRPQLAVYAIGMSDVIRGTALGDYVRDIEGGLDLIVGNGTVPILATITPHRERNDDVLRRNEALRAIAAQRRLPLLDVYAELAARSPDVFDFLADDGFHLTAARPEGPPTEVNFLASGYLLRCFLTVRKGMEVKEAVFDKL